MDNFKSWYSERKGKYIYIPISTGTYNLMPLLTVSLLMRMMMDNVMVAMSQAYSLSNLVAMAMKFCSVTLEMMTVAMANTVAATQMTMQERFSRNVR